MKYLALFIMLLPVMASLSVSPEYVRMPVGSNQTFTISMKGEGGIHDLRVYGPYLDWQAKSVWVGPYGKDAYVTFSPLSEGDYTITAEMDGARVEVVAEVYQPANTDVLQRIQAYRESLKSPEAIAVLNEAERLYNESRFNLAEIKLDEIDDIEPQRTEDSSIPMFVLATFLAIAALLAFRLFL